MSLTQTQDPEAGCSWTTKAQFLKFKIRAPRIFFFSLCKNNPWETQCVCPSPWLSRTSNGIKRVLTVKATHGDLRQLKVMQNLIHVFLLPDIHPSLPINIYTKVCTYYIYTYVYLRVCYIFRFQNIFTFCSLNFQESEEGFTGSFVNPFYKWRNREGGTE